MGEKVTVEGKLLAGKTALITGASEGIGLASAKALAEDGASVVMMGRRVDILEAARDRLRADVPGSRIELFAGDAVKEEDVKRALVFAGGLDGGLDMLVSVVGKPEFMPILMRDLAGVREEMDTNFLSGYLMIREGAPQLPRGGTIVCISSAAVTQSGWGLAVYSAAKAALERFVRAAALELGGAGIRVNALRPGATLPPELAQSPEFREMAAAYAAETPMGRLGFPADIARVVRFLAGPESGWVTGQTFTVDGGMEQGKAPDFMDRIYGKEVMEQIRAGKPVQLQGR